MVIFEDCSSLFARGHGKVCRSCFSQNTSQLLTILTASSACVLEIEMAKWIHNCLNFNSCKCFQSLLLDFHLNIGICLKLSYFLTTSLTLRSIFEDCLLLFARGHGKVLLYCPNWVLLFEIF